MLPLIAGIPVHCEHSHLSSGAQECGETLAFCLPLWNTMNL